MKKGAYFFVLDVLIAAIIIIVTLILIQNAQLTTPSATKASETSKQFVDFLTRTQVRDVQNNYVRSLIDTNNITNLKNTLFDQSIIFYVADREKLLPYFTNLSQSISQNIGIMILINDTLIYNRSAEFMNESSVLTAHRKIGFYKFNKTALYGPYIMEVRTWQ